MPKRSPLTTAAIVLATVVCMVVPPALAKAPTTPDDGNSEAGTQLSTFLPNANLEFLIPRADGKVRIDGDLNDPVWKSAVKLDNFCEVNPGENVRPQAVTETFLCYDDENLYVGFKCYEDDPSMIRASITDRDNIFRDDFIGIMIDTFRDQQNGYEFFVNPHGIQGDLRRNGNNEDSSYDTVWMSGGRITDDGWSAEMALPFRSVRFPDAEDQSWGIHVLRIRPRDSREQISWAPISRDENCTFCAAGVMKGLAGINQGRNLEILPYVIGSQGGMLEGDSDETFDWVSDNGDGDVGVGVKYGVTSNLTLDFTYNPDFSQIESDAAQIDLNNTFALFFPERRPFFLEGADMFSTKVDAVYTRSINDPIAAAKLTGKIGKTTVGFMTAKDDVSPYTVPFEESSGITAGDESYSNILRLKRDVLDDSYVGALVTDRRVGTGNGTNTTYGADTKLRFLESYYLEAHLQASHTEEPDDPSLTEDFDDIRFGDRKQYTSTFDGETYDGYAFETSVNRSARHYNFYAWYDNYSPTFRAENGFIRSNDYEMVGIWNGYTFQFDDHKFLERLEPQFEWGRKVNSDGVFKDTWYTPAMWVRFKKQISAWSGFVFSDERYAGRRVDGIRRWHFDINSDSSNLLSIGSFWRVGRSIVRDSDDPRLGDERYMEVWSTLKPTSQLQVRTDFTYFDMNELGGGGEIFSTYIVRNRLSYQFTRKLFMRLVTEYVDSAKYVQIDPLLSYKINPFTVFFVGSSHSMIEYRDDPDTTEIEVQDKRYREASRVFFVKFQYLFRV